MASQLQLRRGTTAQHAVFTGAPAEVTVDTDKKTVVVHDGSTVGGFPIEGLKDKPAGGALAGTYPNPTLAPIISSGSSFARSLDNRFADRINVKDFGAVGNAKKLVGGSIAAGSNVLICSSASFVSSDVGKSISLGYAGTNSHTLYTTIVAVNSSTQVQLADNAVTTTSISEILYGTEDGPAIRSAVAQARSENKAVYLPRGQYLMNTALSTSSGNPQISSIPVGGGAYGIFLLNNNLNAAQSFYMLGDGASIVSSLYPPQSGNDNGFTFVQISGFFDELHFEGITFDSTRQMVLAFSGTGAAGRVYGFRIGSALSAWNENSRPFNCRIFNCNFYDQTLSIRADNAENLSVSGCDFIYRRGQAGVGDGDWTGAMGVRQIRSLRVVNNYMNGCLTDDLATLQSINPTYTHRCVDNFVHTGGGGLAHFLENCLIADNVVTRFSREGIFVIASPSSSYDNSITYGCFIANNWFDGRYPLNHPVATNWAIRTADAHSTIVGNNIFQATVGILASPSNPVVNGQAAHHTLIDSNNIVLCPASRPGYQGSTGIGISGCDNVTVQNNQIIGHDIGSYRQNGWTGSGTRPTATVASSDVNADTITVTGNVWPDGSAVIFTSLPSNSGLTENVTYFVVNRVGDTFQVSSSFNGSPVDLLVDITGATITAGTLTITVGIGCGGSGFVPTYNPNPPYVTHFIRNNVLKIVSKNSASVLCTAFQIDAGNGTFFVENNIIDGFDFASYRIGGGNLDYIFDNNRITRNLRLNSGYIAANYGAPLLKSHLFEIYPTQTGWYEVPAYSQTRFGAQFDYSISANPENLYGDTTGVTQNGSQVTKLSVSNYDESSGGTGGTNSRLVVSQNHVGQFPAVTKIYIRNYFGGILFYVYVDKVLTKAALTFSGGGGSGAAGYATISGGVVQSVTITNGGSGYTTAPSVSIVGRGIKGSGATFTASLLGNAVDSVAVGGSGGSGYSQPLYFNLECKNTDYNGVALDTPFYTPSTPSNGMEIVLSSGVKTMTLSGGGGGTISGTGSPVIGTALSATGVAATDLITATGHPFANGDRVGFQSLTGGSGLTAGTTYFVRDAVGNDFKLAATSGGAAINFTTDITAATIIPAMPEYIGQHFIDSSNNKVYVATGTAGGKWALLN